MVMQSEIDGTKTNEDAKQTASILKYFTRTYPVDIDLAFCSIFGC